jgi:3-oxoacyl-[acyl-carrier protein] reductase
MDLELKGKRALVTGASSGIGTSIAEHLAAEGAKVVVHGRDESRVEKVVRSIRAAGGIAEGATGDLATDEGAKAVADAARAPWGGIDILVNNAGGLTNATLNWDTCTTADWVATFQLNTLSAVRMCQHFIPEMKANGWGRIIQLSSIGGTTPAPTLVPDYLTAKGGVSTMTVHLAKSLAETGITVNAVSPGYIVTPTLEDYFMSMTENAGLSWEEAEPALARQSASLVGRFGVPSDVALMVAFLASPRNAFINGSTMRVDGGMSGHV